MTQTQDFSRFSTVELGYRYLDGSDIHEINLLGNSREMIEDFFKLLTEIYYSAPTGRTRRILIIHEGTSMPLSSFMNSVRAFISEHRKRARPVPTCFAIVIEKTPFLQLIPQMLKLMRHQDLVMFFNVDEQAKATAWLNQR